MKKNSKKALVFVGLIALATSFTSCNRGYGCPTNFSLSETITEVATTVFVAILKK